MPSWRAASSSASRGSAALRRKFLSTIVRPIAAMSKPNPIRRGRTRTWVCDVTVDPPTMVVTATSHHVTLYVTNDDLFWHTVTIDQLGVEVALPVGSHRRITFTAPSGTYTFYCRIPGHRQAGMQGTITVP